MDRISKKLIEKVTSWQLFVIFYGIPIIQLSTGYAIQVSGFRVGMFPAIFAYCWWIFFLVRWLKPGLGLKVWVLAVCTTALPGYIFIWNAYAESLDPVYLLASGLCAALVIGTVIVSWRALSKSIDRAVFGGKREGRIFFYFLLGPITIWLLQPLIRIACTGVRFGSDSRDDKSI